MPSLNLEIRRLYNTPKRVVKLKKLEKSIVLDFFFENGKIGHFQVAIIDSLPQAVRRSIFLRALQRQSLRPQIFLFNAQLHNYQSLRLPIFYSHQKS